MRIPVLILLCIFVVSTFAKEQEATAGHGSTPDNQISGKVLRQHDKGAPGAVVTLKDAITAETITAKTDKRGQYSFQRLYSGQYSLSATFEDKQSDVQEISLSHKEKLKRDIHLKYD